MDVWKSGRLKGAEDTGVSQASGASDIEEVRAGLVLAARDDPALRLSVREIVVSEAGEDPFPSRGDDAEWRLTVTLAASGQSAAFRLRDDSVVDGDRFSTDLALTVPLGVLLDASNRVRTDLTFRVSASGTEDDVLFDDPLPRLSTLLPLTVNDQDLVLNARNGNFAYDVHVDVRGVAEPQVLAALRHPVAAAATGPDANANSLLSAKKWGGPVGTSDRITYSFPENGAAWVADYSDENEPTRSFQPLNPVQRDGVVQALAAWARIADIEFVQVSEAAGDIGDMRFASSVFRDNPATTSLDERKFAGHAYYPGNLPQSGDVWLNSSVVTSTLAADYGPGQANFFTLLHEIGHALGLKHPHDSGGLGVTATDDWRGTSLMSYRLFPGGSAEPFQMLSVSKVPTTPMAWDIAAIQHLYGANRVATAGDDVYPRNPASVFETVWDAGGNDTIDLNRDFTLVLPGAAGKSITLFPGGASTFGGPYRVTDAGGMVRFETADTLFIAPDAHIENALGSFRNDTLVGSPGDDVLDGAIGDDSLLGLGGANILRGNLGDDTLLPGPDADMVDGGPGRDTVDFLLVRDRPVIADLARGTSSDGTTDTLISIENIVGGFRDDTLSGDDGENRIDGRLGSDEIFGGGGADELLGGAGDGNDTLHGDDGFDTLDGGDGNDELHGDAGDDTLLAGPGADRMFGGADTDTASWLASPMPMNASLLASQAKDGAGIDTLNGIENLIGSAHGDTLVGDGGPNALFGEAGGDVLTGGGGPDRLFGGGDGDVFRFADGDSSRGDARDEILDFRPADGDLIDVSAIDANPAAAGDQAFAWIGAAAFSRAGQLRYGVEGVNTIIRANLDADLAPDVAIVLAGFTGTLQEANFML
jgi:serralysin